jgi:hypothetical protein
MPDFNQHFDQALENIGFVQKVSENHTNELRWKITAAYYTAYHLIQAFLAQKANLHPDTHTKLKGFIAPQSIFTTTRLPAAIYTSFIELEILSRKARYDSHISITENHFSKTIEHLDAVIDFFKKQYSASVIPHLNVYCFNSGLCKKHKHSEVLEKMAL